MKKLLWVISVTILMISCRPNNSVPDPTPYVFSYPSYFPTLQQPGDNVATEEGVALGRKLFFDEILSLDYTQSCGSCHFPSHSFSDSTATSVGVDGIAGTRNAMTIVNLGWQKDFFWDLRSESLEEQALEPVPNPIEMHLEWPEAVSRLKADGEYPELFEKAFGSKDIDRYLVAKAIAQFERSLISQDSKFDKFLRGEAVLTPEELSGYDLFNTERGDCFHCHGASNTGFQFTDNLAHNNGLDSVFTDLGLYDVTGDPMDKAKFKTPTLRNIALTAPYMHDGRFENLDEVIEHYNTGGHLSPTIDPLMKAAGVGRFWTPQEKADLKAFLHTLTDETFINNPDFQDPE
jgi:cytochrome c peroxidase